jgi:hypothetical protein
VAPDYEERWAKLGTGRKYRSRPDLSVTPKFSYYEPLGSKLPMIMFIGRNHPNERIYLGFAEHRFTKCVALRQQNYVS